MNKELGAMKSETANNRLKWPTMMKRESVIQSVFDCWKRAVQMARASIGVPDYDTYVAHIREHHPERVPMSYGEFFTQRQNARYKGGGGRCC
jgi:uncharacterized short protein YbdD (DUF466 family)